MTDVYDLSRLTEVTASRGQWLVGILLTLAFTLLARGMRGVTNSGALAGAVICIVLYRCGGPGAFAALISVFALAWVTTRLGYQRKQKLGIAERREGRKASQVLANLGVAAACAAFSVISHSRGLFLLAAAAALSEAAADTVSSEMGQAFGEKARLSPLGALSLPAQMAPSAWSEPWRGQSLPELWVPCVLSAVCCLGSGWQSRRAPPSWEWSRTAFSGPGWRGGI